MAINLIVTNAGRAALVNAVNTGTAPVIITQVGLSATAVVPVKTLTALAGEFKRLGGVGGDVVADDTIHISAIDESADTYSLRSFALYLGDGTLFAIYGQPTPILDKATAAFVGLSIDVIFADIDAALLSFGDTDFLLPQATTEARGTVELATTAETQTGTDTVRALTPKGASDVYAKLTGANFTGAVRAFASPATFATATQIQVGEGTQNPAYRISMGYYIKDGQWRGALNVLHNNGAAPLDIQLSGGESTFGGLVRAANGSDEKIILSGTDDPFIRGYNSAAAPTGFVQFSNGFTTLGAYGSRPIYFQCNSGITAAVDSTGLSISGVLAVSGNITRAGNTVWHAGNDGAGSGLDADLLDGRQAAEFALLTGATFSGGVASQSYFQTGGNGTLGGVVVAPGNPTNVGYISFRNAANAQTGHIGNNADGSALDISCPSGFRFLGGTVTINIAGGEKISLRGSADPFIRGYGASGSQNGFLQFADSGYAYLASYNPAGGVALQVNSSNRFVVEAGGATLNGGLTVTGPVTAAGGNTVWHTGNDGSGSGLDADLLDGFQAADFLRETGRLFTETGYLVLNNGLILQWGSIAGSWLANTDIPVTFPVAFPTRPLMVVGSNSDVVATPAAVVGVNYSPGPTSTGFNFRSNVGGQLRFNWISIGI